MEAQPAVRSGDSAADDAATRSDVALAALFTVMHRDLLRLAVVLVDDPGTAEDLVQDAFAATHRHWAGLRDEDAAAAYLRRATLNGARSELRRRRTRRRHTEPPPPHTAAADDAVLAAEERSIVVAAVRSLPARQRDVVLLRYWQGLTEAEIAATLGISRGSVKSAASRGLDRVQRTLERSSP